MLKKIDNIEDLKFLIYSTIGCSYFGNKVIYAGEEIYDILFYDNNIHIEDDSEEIDDGEAINDNLYIADDLEESIEEYININNLIVDDEKIVLMKCKKENYITFNHYITGHMYFIYFKLKTKDKHLDLDKISEVKE